MSSIFDTLISLPIFNGVSREVMAQTVGRFKFHFKKFAPDDIVVEPGTQCRSMIFIIKGTAGYSRTLPNGMQLKKTLRPGALLHPEFLFGKSTDHPAEVRAIDAVSTLEIDKADFLNIVESEPVFMFNFLNIISRKAQKPLHRAPDSSFKTRFAALVDYFTETEDTEISISSPKNIWNHFSVAEEEYHKTMSLLKDMGIVSYCDNSRIILANRNLLTEKF